MQLKESAAALSVLFSVCLLLAMPNEAIANDFGKACRESPKLVGECFTTRGRLNVANGGWNLRIWPIGTNRLLAVVDASGVYDEARGRYLPHEVEAALKIDKTAVFADYTLCPVTRDVPGSMRHVCVVDASNIRAEPQ